MKSWNKQRYFLTIIGTVLCLSAMLFMNYMSHYNSIMSKMQNMSMGLLNETKEKVEKYLIRDKEVVQNTAFALEYMIENDVSTEKMEEYLVYESRQYRENVDEKFSGIYGYINGNFIDGSGWIPGEDYVPTEREWYVEAQKAMGETVLVSPMLDAKTNTMVMTVSKMFSDKESVLAIDIRLNEIQKLVESVELNSEGYSFIVDGNGRIISHTDKNENGKNYLEDTKMAELLNVVFSNEQSQFEREIGEKRYQICSTRIMEDWYVVMVLDKDVFFKDVKDNLIRNIMLYGIISCLILFFYIISFRRIRHSIEAERESNEKLEQMNINMIRALVRTIDAKDRYTNGHSVRVADYALRIAKELGKNEEEQRIVYYAGLLHDVGKIRIPGEIINKPGKLTDEEFNHIKIHPVTGYHIMKDIYDDKIIAVGAKFHHERYDGKGYPCGLEADNIPEIARIICVADTYDAMTSNRSYRDALPQEKVREEFLRCRGTQFDPEITDIMIKMIDEDVEYNMREHREEEKTILIVDDESMNIKIIQHFMKDETEYKIVSAASGEEALKKLEKLAVHLVVMDVEMPGMDGFETLLKIREKYDVPVVFMTGDKDINTIQRAMNLGVVDYISKPISAFTFKEIVHSMLNG